MPALRVLMLGKNNITHIENLEPLRKLDVLDLHSNKIQKIQRLSHFIELRVLNLGAAKILFLSFFFVFDFFEDERGKLIFLDLF